MSAGKGVDFGFEKPLATLIFRDLEGKKLLGIKVGSFSNEQEVYFSGDDSFFMFFKKVPMIQTLKNLSPRPN